MGVRSEAAWEVALETRMKSSPLQSQELLRGLLPIRRAISAGGLVVGRPPAATKAKAMVAWSSSRRRPSPRRAALIGRGICSPEQLPVLPLKSSSVTAGNPRAEILVITSAICCLAPEVVLPLLKSSPGFALEVVLDLDRHRWTASAKAGNLDGIADETKVRAAAAAAVAVGASQEFEQSQRLVPVSQQSDLVLAT